MPTDSSDIFLHWTNASRAATEDEYLNSFEHPENLTLPELMVLKRRLMGLPAKAMAGYVMTVLLILLTGAVGLKRYTPQEFRSCTP